MKDIPIFTGQFGMASLILREIPVKNCAYVMVRDAQRGRLRAFLEECRQACSLAGADHILATAEEPIDFLPHVHDMLELVCRKSDLPAVWEPVALIRVTEELGSRFLQHYNALFRDIPNAATYYQADVDRILKQERAYLASVQGEVAGIGEVTDTELCAIGVLPPFRGLGERLALTLLREISAEEVTLRVSSSNVPALRLYEKLGFSRRRVLSRWYGLAGFTGE